MSKERYTLPRHKDSFHGGSLGTIGRTTGKELHLVSAAEWKRAAEQIMAAVRAIYPTLKRLPKAAKEDVARAKDFFRRAKLHEKRASSKSTARLSRRHLENELWKVWPKAYRLTPGPRAIRMKTMTGYADATLSSLSDEEILHLLHPAHRSPAGRPPARKRVKSMQSVARAGRRDPAISSHYRPYRGPKVIRIDVIDVTPPQRGKGAPIEHAWAAEAFNAQDNIVYSVTRSGTDPERAFRALINGIGYSSTDFTEESENHFILKSGRDPAKTKRGSKRISKRDPAPTGKVRCGLLLRRITQVAEESVRSKRIGTPQALLDSKGDWELVETLKKTAQKAGCSGLQISEAVNDGVQFGRKAVLGESFWKRRDPDFAHCPVGTQVQSLILDASHFDTRDAAGWAKRHGFRVSKVDKTAHSFRFRQREPSTFVQNSFRTITMRPGVKAVIGCPK
jgi:hypothetical protein